MLILNVPVLIWGGKIMKNNKGFSLVELIIVIAIMAVLVGVLAPQFIKYVEQSRRSKDIQNADQIREAFLADIAEGKTTGTGNMTVTLTAANLPSSINDTPYVAGNVVNRGDTFTAEYDATTNTVGVYVTTDYNGSKTYNLTNESDISAYRNA